MKISGTSKQASAGQVGPRNAALRPTRRLDPRRIPKYIVAAFFLAAGFYFAATTLCAIINFAWRQPMFDQYRSYATFLSLPFPQNILQSDNGHHPVIPNLFRLAEIHWFATNQLLQISVGTCCAFLSATIISVSVWRTRNLPLVARAAGVMLAVLGLLWLANARMLLHGNESLDVYLGQPSDVAARGAFDDEGGDRDASADKRRAREILLRELIALEAARRADKIGPRSYDQSRLRLIDAIARLGLPAERSTAGRKSASGTSARKRSKSTTPRG